MSIKLTSTYTDAFTCVGEAKNEKGELCGKYSVTFVPDDDVYHWNYQPGNVAYDFVGKEHTMVSAQVSIIIQAAAEDRKWQAWVEQADQYAREAHGE